MFELPKLDRLLTAEDFAPWVGADVHGGRHPEPVYIQLAQITPLRVSSLAYRDGVQPVLPSRPDVLLVDGTYAIRCGRFGPLDIHLTAVISPPGEQIYEAVFN